MALLASSGAAAQQFPVEREIPVSAGEMLEMDLDAGGSIEIVGGAGSVVHVRVTEDDRGCRPACEVSIEKVGSGVWVISDHVSDSNIRSGDLHFEIQVPQRFNLRLNTMGGDISIENVTGDISGETMGGELELHRLGGTIDLTTMGGEIEITDSNVDGRVHTMGGEVLVENVTGNLDAGSMGGEVTRRGGAVATSEIQIETMGGDIELSDAPLGADVHTMGGDIEIASAGDHVKARTMGGDIDLEAVNGWIEATTMGGDVEVRMVGDPSTGRRDVEITSMSGDIELTVPAGLSMNVVVELTFTEGHEGDYEITSDLALQQSITPEWDHSNGSPRKVITATGSANGGEHEVRLKTVNGDVTLHVTG
ncbi:MAG TPA: DUF4097 family beta strand repeat-containing protein [Longimicrobiaceae bacterium]|nr:DUF4097 family beta strand repeat-containing protein [Longimicrobiaceae bacterium]